MRAEEYLRKVRDMKISINSLQRQRDDIKNNIGLIKSSGYERPAIGSPSKDKLEKQIIKNIAELESIDRKIADERVSLIRCRKECFDMIMQLKDGQCRRFLLDYFIECKNEIEIANEYHFDNINSIYNLKRRAIRYFRNVHKTNYKTT